MRHIDMERHKPSQKWLEKSDRLTKQLIALHEAGDIVGRNELIEKNAKHWGELKKWLLNRSYNKCWFSEARDIYSHMDVEHFRPKIEVKDLSGMARDGYWRLAFDYRNFRACGNVGNRKKGGWFPLQAGSLVSTYDNQCEESEMPYLRHTREFVHKKFPEIAKAITSRHMQYRKVLREERAVKLRQVIREAIVQITALGDYVSEARVKEYAKGFLPSTGRSSVFKQALQEIKTEMGLTRSKSLTTYYQSDSRNKLEP